jgi:hypothetical protein
MVSTRILTVERAEALEAITHHLANLDGADPDLVRTKPALSGSSAR